jgi:hypothetical protein
VAQYDLARPDGTCPKQADGDAELVVRSTARTSYLARAWRRAYVGLGTPMPLPRAPAFARGVTPGAVHVDGVASTAFVLPVASGRTGVYSEDGDTAIVITGPFGSREVQSVVEELEG